MKTTKHLLIHGRVQGVNYRESMRMQAQRLNVTGWVRNRSDGTVEAVLQGSLEEVAQMIDWCRVGPPGARVTSLRAEEASGTFEAFERWPSL